MRIRARAIAAGFAVLLSLAIAFGCGPGRPAAAIRPAIDIAALQKEIGRKGALTAVWFNLFLAFVISLITRVIGGILLD